MKCEEYLNQIQRSADLIEHSKSSYDTQLTMLNQRLDEVVAMLKEEQDRVDIIYRE